MTKFKPNNKVQKKRRSSNTASVVSKGCEYQERVAIEDPSWFKHLVPNPCPMCEHSNLVLSPDTNSMIEIIEDMDKEYKKRMAAWDAKCHSLIYRRDGKKKKYAVKTLPSKPSCPNYPKQYLVCMCAVTKCQETHKTDQDAIIVMIL